MTGLFFCFFIARCVSLPDRHSTARLKAVYKVDVSFTATDPKTSSWALFPQVRNVYTSIVQKLLN